MYRMAQITAIVIGLLAAGCSAPAPAPTPFPTLPPIPLTLAPATAAPTATVTVARSATPQPTFTALPIVAATANPRTSPTSTRPVAAVSPTAAGSPTVSTAGLPAGVYVTDLRTDPNPPNRTAELKFYATFANATASPQNYRWTVYIYRFDAPARSTGETSVTQLTLPVGTSEWKSDGFWRLGPGNQCENFFARVAWLDQDKRPSLFTRPDGKVFEKSMTLCP